MSRDNLTTLAIIQAIFNILLMLLITGHNKKITIMKNYIVESGELISVVVSALNERVEKIENENG